MFFAVLVAVAISVAASIIAHRRAPGRARSRLLQALTGLSIGLLPTMFQRADADHVYYAACVCVATLPIALSVIIEAHQLKFPRILAPATYAVFLVATILSTTPAGLPVSNAGRQFYVGPAEVSVTESLLTDVDRIARPGQRLFVGPTDLRRTNFNSTYLYFLLPDLVPSTYFLEMNPLTANAPGSRLAADVASADVVVLTSRWDGWNEPNASSHFGSDAPNQVIRTLFCLRATDGTYRVYTRCSATSPDHAVVA
jgi:hypothetical protein